jgi:hypothetical protein
MIQNRRPEKKGKKKKTDVNEDTDENCIIKLTLGMN